jgi:hypothetical protein
MPEPTPIRAAGPADPALDGILDAIAADPGLRRRVVSALFPVLSQQLRALGKERDEALVAARYSQDAAAKAAELADRQAPPADYLALRAERYRREARALFFVGLAGGLFVGLVLFAVYVAARG